MGMTRGGIHLEMSMRLLVVEGLGFLGMMGVVEVVEGEEKAR